MAGNSGIGRRALLRGGFAATAIGGFAVPGVAAAEQHRARVRQPQVFGTRQWRARPPSDPIVVEDHAPVYIVVHHTVKPGNTDDYSLDRAFEISRAMQNFHMDSRGWIDTGQQFTISRGGWITEGRHRSWEILREGRRHVVGANVRDHNRYVIGIENEGLYTKENMPESQWNSMVDLVSYMAYQYDIHPNLIKGHRDFNSTQCPGDVLYARLPQLRAEVAARLGMPLIERVEWPSLLPGDRSR
ncbi:MAG: peptidoglycan recognition protein family protein [Haloechinothrix sp.]